MGKQQHAPGELERLREFVNTLDIETASDELATPGQLRRWLVDHDLASPGTRVTRADVDRATSLREALRAILLTHTNEGVPAPTAWRTLDEIARRAEVGLRFDERGAASVQPSAGGVDGALGRLLATVQAASADGSWSRLKACREPSCEWAFYDYTKNRSGAWCTMEVCGNRAKARAYRERRAAAR